MTEAIETREAVYFFVPQLEERGLLIKHTDKVRVTKLVRKGQKGYDQSTTVTKEFAQQWADRLYETACLDT